MSTLIPPSPVSHDAIVNAVIIAVSEESGRPATLDSDLQDDLNLDSLSYIHLAQQLETAFDITISDADLFRLSTVNQVVCYVVAWKQKQAEIASAVAASE